MRTSCAWDASLPVPSLKAHTATALVFLVAVICFAPSFNGQFVFDDTEAILNNRDVTENDVSLYEIFTHDFWGSKVMSNQSHKSYRPLTILSFRLDRYWASELNPRTFHAVNILLHATISALLVPIFSLFFSPSFPSSKASLLSALLFAVCPVHTESVAAVVGRADLLSTLCFLLSFYFYSVACRRDDEKAWLILAVSVMWCVASTLCKEQGITVIGVCSAYDILMVQKYDLLYYVKSHPKLNNNNNKPLYRPPPRSLMLRHCVLLLNGCVLLLFRWQVMGSSVPHFQTVDNPQSFMDSWFYRVLNYNYLYSINGWLLIFPHWLCFDWSMGCVPLIESIADPRNAASLCFWLLLWAIVIKSFASWNNSSRCLLFSLALVILPFLPASNLFFRVGFVIAERVLYLPSIGYIMIIVLGTCHLSTILRPRIMSVFIYSLLITNAARSSFRSYEWTSEELLFHSGEKVCPLNAKVHYNMAKIFTDQGKIENAVLKYKLALRLHPEYDQAMNNLANIYKDKGLLKDAEVLLLEATRLRRAFPAAWMNLGIVQAALHKTKLAEESYMEALQHRRKYADCFYNLGNLYLDTNRPNDALSAWRNATILKPLHLSAWGNMIILLDNSDRLEELEIVAEEALKHLPNEAYLHYNYANALGKASLYEKSEKHFSRAIELNPNTSTYYANLGVLYHRWGRLSLAEKSYRRALELDPNHQSAEENLQMLKRKKLRM